MVVKHTRQPATITKPSLKYESFWFIRPGIVIKNDYCAYDIEFIWVDLFPQTVAGFTSPISPVQ
ncbi:MAG: hypothetical protein RLZZ360_471 [Candidatus Parcubacteria bacterium]|jgi:hypothetical protein